MHAVGIICEYNPFHYGHIYHIEQVKQKFPNSVIILALNGYFLERGEISILSKEKKAQLALQYGVNLVVEIPVFFGTQAADVFAQATVDILHSFGVSDIVFGSESNDPTLLLDLAQKQFDANFPSTVQAYLKQGVNYPTALSKSISSSVREPNDLLGISYAKAILKKNYPIQIHTILRTNSYHAEDGDGSIVSAQTIRTRLKQNKTIHSMVPKEVLHSLKAVDEKTLWMLLRYRILTDAHLDSYLTVDEGIESRLRKVAMRAKSYEEFVNLVKTKRYTYNKIRRMTIHILLGITKVDKDMTTLTYFHVLGFDNMGQAYLKMMRTRLTMPLKPISSKLYEFEKRATFLYEILTNSSVSSFEFANRPIQKKENSLFDK